MHHKRKDNMKRTVYSISEDGQIVTSLFHNADSAICFFTQEFIFYTRLDVWFRKYNENNIETFERDLRSKGKAELTTDNGISIYKVVELEVEYRCEVKYHNGKNVVLDFLDWMDIQDNEPKYGNEPTFDKSEEVDDVFLLLEDNSDGVEIIAESYSSAYEAMESCKECIKEKEEWHDIETDESSDNWKKMMQHLKDYWSCDYDEIGYYWYIVKVAKITEHE